MASLIRSIEPSSMCSHFHGERTQISPRDQWRNENTMKYVISPNLKTEVAEILEKKIELKKQV